MPPPAGSELRALGAAGLAHVRRVLGDAGPFSRLLRERVAWGRGETRSLLPAGTRDPLDAGDLQHAWTSTRATAGAPFDATAATRASRAWVEEALRAFLAASPRAVVLVEDTCYSGVEDGAEPTAGRTARFQGSVLGLLGSDLAPSEIRRRLDFWIGPPHGTAFLAAELPAGFAGDDRGGPRPISAGQAEALAEGAFAVGADAFDGEGWILWTRRASGVGDQSGS